MLGSVTYQILKKDGRFRVSYTQRNDRDKNNYFDVLEMQSLINILDRTDQFQYIINCIGITQAEFMKLDKQSAEEKIMIANSIFPEYLSEVCLERGIKIINISSDGVFSGKSGPYTELDRCDPIGIYNVSKLNGEIDASNVLNIRCSIIGPDSIKKRGLYEWFKNSKEPIIYGYSNQIWNGITTFQYARLCRNIFLYEYFDKLRFQSSVYHVDINEQISKYELLNIFREKLKKNVKLLPKETNNSINRVLKSKFKIINELYFIDGHAKKCSWKKLISEFI